MLQSGSLNRVTVIDDDELGREELMDDLRDCSFEPHAVVGQFGQDIDRLINEIRLQSPGFVICDHKLQPQNLASFHGLEVVKRLVAEKTPAMLLTMYQSTDRLELREFRHNVPVIMGRDAFDPEAVHEYADICNREIAANPVDTRRAHRSLIRVDWVDPQSGNLDAVIDGWNTDRAITIPARCINDSIRSFIVNGAFLMGDINIGAESEDDLFFANLDEILDPAKIRDLP